MKKTHLLLLTASLSLALASCSKKASSIESPLSDQSPKTSTSSPLATAPADTKGTSAPITYSKIDLDLTSQSPTMIYAQVFNMMLDPDSFNGKVIKLKGACAIFQDQTLNRAFYACIVKDATACCAQGLEFVLSDEYSIEEYPTENADITIIGRFETYKLNGLDSFHLTGTKLVEK